MGQFQSLLPPRQVYHGTDADFDEFDLDRCFGAHLGTLKAARDRLRDLRISNIEYDWYQAEDGIMVMEGRTCGRPGGFEHGPFASIALAQAFIAHAPPEREPLAFEIDVCQPLLLGDLGCWKLDGVVRALGEAKPEFSVHIERIYSQWSLSDKAGWEALKRALECCGHDSVAYLNETEDPGSMSWIVLRAERIHHVWRDRGHSDNSWALNRSQARRERCSA